MKTIFLLVSLLILSSCNALQVLTGDETSIPDDFFRLTKGPSDQLIFFSSEAEVFVLDTKTEAVTQITTLAALTGQVRFVRLNGKIYFASMSKIYSYVPGSINAILEITDAKDGIMTPFGNMLAYINSTGELAMYDGVTTTSTSTAESFSMVTSMTTLFYNNVGTIYVCDNGLIKEVLNPQTGVIADLAPSSSASRGQLRL